MFKLDIKISIKGFFKYFLIFTFFKHFNTTIMFFVANYYIKIHTMSLKSYIKNLTLFRIFVKNKFNVFIRIHTLTKNKK